VWESGLVGCWLAIVAAPVVGGVSWQGSVFGTDPDDDFYVPDGGSDGDDYGADDYY